MSNHKDGVNPLRPYYIPPTIGEAPDTVSSAASLPRNGNATASSGYASKARDMLQDLDYNYMGDSQPTMVQNLKDLVDELLWKYTSVLMAQPFEVAKTILQTRDQDPNAGLAPSQTPGPLMSRSTSYAESIREVRNRRCSMPQRVLIKNLNQESDSDGEEPDYFTSNIPNSPSPLNSRRQGSRRGHSPTRPGLTSSASTKSLPSGDSFITLRRPDSVMDVITQLWQKEGAWGVWKGSNATFLYTVLQSLMENWSRSFLSAILNVPDLGVKDDIDRLIDIATPYPWVSLVVAASASVATGVILAPLDLVRTR